MQGDRTKKVGVIDSEYIVHKGIQTLGGRKTPKRKVILFSLFSQGGTVYDFYLSAFYYLLLISF